MKHHIKQTAMRGFLRFKNWWFFGAPTFWLDVILAIGLIDASISFAVDGDVLVAQHHIYQKFADVPIWLLVSVPFASALLLLCSMRGSDTSVGFARLCASFVWGLGFIAYYHSYPPLSMNILWSFSLMFLGTLASFQQLFAADRRERCENLIASGKAVNQCNKQ